MNDKAKLEILRRVAKGFDQHDLDAIKASLLALRAANRGAPRGLIRGHEREVLMALAKKGPGHGEAVDGNGIPRSRASVVLKTGTLPNPLVTARVVDAVHAQADVIARAVTARNRAGGPASAGALALKASLTLGPEIPLHAG